MSQTRFNTVQHVASEAPYASVLCRMSPSCFSVYFYYQGRESPALMSSDPTGIARCLVGSVSLCYTRWPHLRFGESSRFFLHRFVVVLFIGCRLSNTQGEYTCRHGGGLRTTSKTTATTNTYDFSWASVAEMENYNRVRSLTSSASLFDRQ